MAGPWSFKTRAAFPWLAARQESHGVIFLLNNLPGRRRVPSPSPLSFHDYAERYAGLVRTRHPDAELTVTHGESAARTRVLWRGKDGFKTAQFMGNWYGRYLAEPARLQAILEAQVDSARATGLCASPSSLGIDAILPAIKTTAWLEVSASQLSSIGVPADQQPASRLLVGDLSVTYVEDKPGAVRYLSAVELQGLDLDVSSVHEVALGNLASRVPGLQVRGKNGPYTVRLDGIYDASLVLFLDQWVDRLPLKGVPVMAVAARDELMVCGSEDAASLATLRVAAAHIAGNSAYGLSGRLFAWRGGRLQELGG
jgi:hypothetical protein